MLCCVALGDVGDAFYLTVFGELHVKKDQKVLIALPLPVLPLTRVVLCCV